jgi:hypothetical protein
MTFAAPLDPRTEPDDARLREGIRRELDELERRCDPLEAAARAPAAGRPARGEVSAPLQ